MPPDTRGCSGEPSPEVNSQIATPPESAATASEMSAMISLRLAAFRSCSSHFGAQVSRRSSISLVPVRPK